MRTAEQILEEALHLPPKERRKILERLQQATVGKNRTTTPKGRGRYSRTLEMAGTVHSDHTDVSQNKQKHLTEIFDKKRRG